MAHDVFISYSNKDKTVADAICSRLENEGVRCWYAPRDIAPGADWAGSIIDAIEETRVLVLVFTDFSNASRQVLREVNNAVRTGAVIVPFRLTPSAPSGGMRYYLSAVHWLDAMNAPLEESIRQLSEVVHSILNGSPAAPSHDTPAVTQEHEIIDTVPLVQKIADIIILVDPVTVDLHKAVPHLQSFRALIGAAVHKALNRRGNKGSCTEIKAEDHHKAEQEIVERAGTEDQNTLPGRLRRKCARIVGIAVFPFHRAVAAERYGTKRIERLTLLFFPDGGSHADRELVDLHTAELCHGEMAELVNGDQDAENQNRNDNVSC